MALTADEAFELSRTFRDMAKQVGDTRIEKWDELKPSERQELENEEWDLLSAAMSMRTKAVGLVLDEAGSSLSKIIRITESARKAVKSLEKARASIAIATTAVTLAAAVLSKDPQAIAKSAQALHEEVKAALA